MHKDHEVSRLSRLAAMLTMLLSRRLLTAPEMARKFDVSIRTIYRDIRALEAAGIPVVTEEGRGYSLLDGYKLPPVMFTEEEAYALITSEQVILRSKDISLKKGYSSAITKIKAVLSSASQARTELLSERMYIDKNRGQQNSSDSLLPLQKALTGHQVVRLRYQAKDGEESERDVEPFAIYHSFEEDWTMVAFCRLRGDFRSFRLDRIRSIEVTQTKFEPHTLTIQQYAEKFVRRRNP